MNFNPNFDDFFAPDLGLLDPIHCPNYINYKKLIVGGKVDRAISYGIAKLHFRLIYL